jgi:NADH-quinone oxidoreductase subunit M
MIFGLPVISVAIWMPILFGVLVLATGDDRNASLARVLSLVGSVLSLLVTIPLYTDFARDTSEMQFVELHDWIMRFNIHYSLGVDGISMPFILLTAFFTPIVVLAGWKVIEKRVSQYMASFLIMSGIMIGVFAALDSILFYVFWESMLIPMFLIIGVWGGRESRLCRRQVFPLYLIGFATDVGGFDLFV